MRSGLRSCRPIGGLRLVWDVSHSLNVVGCSSEVQQDVHASTFYTYSDS